MAYSSNCPISRPAQLDYEVDASFDGIAWNNKYGLFIPVEGDMLPMKHPHLLSYKDK